MRPGLVTTLLVIGACIVPEYGHAATHARSPFAGPTATCNFEHRMEIQVIDGVWYECMCLALAFGWDCAWVELPEPVVDQIRRQLKLKHVRVRSLMSRTYLNNSHVVVRYALPQVTA